MIEHIILLIVHDFCSLKIAKQVSELFGSEFKVINIKHRPEFNKNKVVFLVV